MGATKHLSNILVCNPNNYSKPNIQSTRFVCKFQIDVILDYDCNLGGKEEG